jgi:hypothetical protein
MDINLLDVISFESLQLEQMCYKIIAPTKAIKFVGEGMFEFDIAKMTLYFWYPGKTKIVLWDKCDVPSLDQLVSLEGNIFHNGHSGRCLYSDSMNGYNQNTIGREYPNEST